ncbi:MAG TPA: restriction endonuclease subunit S [Myxococcota bacterium]|nr:restriction endonuclease subunit S [Myxococcota bacterium]
MSSQLALPTGWVEAHLETVALVIQGQSPPGSTYNLEGEGLPFFQGKAEFGDLHPIPVKWCSAPNKIAEPCDVLISVRAPVGPTNLADRRCCIGRGLAAIRPLAGMPSKYFLYYLRHTGSLLAKQATGTTFKAINGDQLCKHPVWIPPYTEQKRIIEAIESNLTKLDAAVAALKRVKSNLKRYRASVLKAAVEGRLVPTEAELARKEGRDYEPASKLLERILKERRRRWEEAELEKLKAKGKIPKTTTLEQTALEGDKKHQWKAKYKEPKAPDTTNLPELPEGWCWASLEQLSSTIRNGYSKAPRETSGVPILRISAVRPMSVDTSDIRFLPLPIAAYEGFVIANGDLLFTRYNGNPHLVGVCGLVKKLNQPIVHPDKLIRVEIVTGNVDPGFIEIACNCGVSRSHVEKRVRTTAGQSGISGGDLKAMPIPVPPLLEQRRVFFEVQRVWSVADSVERIRGHSERKCTFLKQSILKAAFEGKLVEQCSEDEPASVLLNRIEAERDSAGMESSRGKKGRKGKMSRAKDC